MKAQLLGAAIYILTLSTTVLAETTNADVIGTWRTAVAARPAPDGSTVYLQTETVLTKKRQDLVFSIYADPERQTKLFEYSSGGTWESQGPSKDVQGAMAVNMVNDRSVVTIFIDAPAFWATLNLAECPLAIGEAVDISDCVTGPPFGQGTCVDMDIIMVDQDGRRLRYGGGGVDRCVVRPTEMSTDEYFRAQ